MINWFPRRANVASLHISYNYVERINANMMRRHQKVASFDLDLDLGMHNDTFSTVRTYVAINLLRENESICLIF